MLMLKRLQLRRCVHTLRLKIVCGIAHPPVCRLKKVMYVYKLPTDLVCEFDWLRVVENVRSSNSFSRARAWNSSRTKAADGAETNGLLRHRFQMIVSDHKSLMSSFSAPAGFSIS